MARSQVVERVRATDSLQNLCSSHFTRFLRIRGFFQGVSLTGNSDSFLSDGRWRQNPSSHAHFSQSCCVLHSIALFTCTCERVAQVKLVTWLGRVAHRPLFTYLTHFHHFVPRHRWRHLIHCCRKENQENPLRHSASRDAVWLNHPSHHIVRLEVPWLSSSSSATPPRHRVRRIHRLHGIQQIHEVTRKHQETGAWMPLESSARVFPNGQRTSENLEIVEMSAATHTSHDSNADAAPSPIVAAKHHEAFLQSWPRRGRTMPPLSR